MPFAHSKIGMWVGKNIASLAGVKCSSTYLGCLYEQVLKRANNEEEKNQPRAFFSMKTRMTLPTRLCEQRKAVLSRGRWCWGGSESCGMLQLPTLPYETMFCTENSISVLPQWSLCKETFFSHFSEDLWCQSAFPCTSWLQATQLSFFITVLLFLQYQSYHPACCPQTLQPAGILAQPGDKPWNFLSPSLSPSHSPLHPLPVLSISATYPWTSLSSL